VRSARREHVAELAEHDVEGGVRIGQGLGVTFDTINGDAGD
jgi:hypothetical protein